MSVKYALRLVDWYTGDDHGSSSEVIAAAMSGADVKRHAYTPSDSDDLGRCLRLLALFPEWTPDKFTRIMSAVSPEWKCLVKAWPKLKACMEDEIGPDFPRGIWGPKTYDMIRSLEVDAPAQTEERP